MVLWGSALRDVGRTGKGHWGEAGLAKGNTEGVPPVTWPISGGAGQEGMSRLSIGSCGEKSLY